MEGRVERRGFGGKEWGVPRERGEWIGAKGRGECLVKHRPPLKGTITSRRTTLGTPTPPSHTHPTTHPPPSNAAPQGIHPTAYSPRHTPPGTHSKAHSRRHTPQVIDPKVSM